MGLEADIMTNAKEPDYHTPVLLDETVDALQLHPGDVVIDGTVGGGGHTAEILKRVSPNGVVIGFDQDQAAINYVQTTLGQIYSRKQLHLIHDNFNNLPDYERELRTYPAIHAILLDLGISLHQVRSHGRGFSFQATDDPLDMRMDERSSITAAHLLNSLSQQELELLIRENGEEPHAKRIAQAIVQRRVETPLTTVHDLRECIYEAYAGKAKPQSHIATRTFQALRIAVNHELEYLPHMLETAIATLSSGGRLAVITFHSLEDRIVKRYFREASLDCICPVELPECRCQHTATIRRITRKPIRPSATELSLNPKARSAQLRVVEKI